MCRAKELDNDSGFCGRDDYAKGFLWERFKKYAMQDMSNSKYIVVSCAHVLIDLKLDGSH